MRTLMVTSGFGAQTPELWQSVALQMTIALSNTAQRKQTAGIILPNQTNETVFQDAKIIQDKKDFSWLDGFFATNRSDSAVHSLSPIGMISGQSSATISVPNTLAWEENSGMHTRQKLLIKSSVKRAVKNGDTIVVHDHATADFLREKYGQALNVAVIPLAAPREFLLTDTPQNDVHTVAIIDDKTANLPICNSLTKAESDVRAKELKLPDEYLLTTAELDNFDRLKWAADAVLQNFQLPPLLVLTHKVIPGALQELADTSDGRIIPVAAEHLSDTAVALAGATALILPQKCLPSPFIAYAALEHGLPVFFAADNPAVAEITVDAGIACTDGDSLQQFLIARLMDSEKLKELRVLATDRASVYTWESTARAIWRLHAQD